MITRSRKEIKKGVYIMKKNSIIKAIREEVENEKTRSAWTRGVKDFALGMIEELEEGIERGWIDEEALYSPKLLTRALLNGAEDWKQYSWGGSALIYDGDIAAALCNPSELKKTRNGERRPNSCEEWLDVQARALWQAARLIQDAARRVTA